MGAMENVTIRRTFAIGNFESLCVEATAEGKTIEEARLLASKKVLELSKQEFIRIFSIRGQNINGNPWEQVVMELQGVEAELSTFRS